MDDGKCVDCPYRFKTSPGCCRGCDRLAVQAVMAPTPTTQFLESHPAQGFLRIQAFRGDQVLPMPGVDVVVSREDQVYFQGKTDVSGIIEGIALPGQNRMETLNPETARSSAVYRVQAEYPGYVPVDTQVDIFAQEKTILPIAFHLQEVT